MDEENTIDFQALKAKFQNEELLQKQPRSSKPVLPDKPKQVPPPQSPTYYLPAGARPSLLTSINQSLEAKTTVIPRVVFKDDKKESKQPLVQTNSKGKDKSEGKLKAGKDKSSKSTKTKSEDASSDQKQKKERSKDKRFSLLLPTANKDGATDLVPATAPPKSSTTKKGFMGFGKSKRGSLEISADPILDSFSPDIPGPAPLIPVPSGFDDATAQADISSPKTLMDLPASPDSIAPIEVPSPFSVPNIPNFSPPPAFIPEAPTFKVASPESKTPPEMKPTAKPTSTRPSQPESTSLHAPPVASTPPPPEPEVTAEAGVEAVKMAAVAAPPPAVDAAALLPPSPKAERSSVLSALGRAEDMSPGKRTSLSDQRIFNALEKARKKTPSPLTNLTTSDLIIAPLEERPQSPSLSLPELPPIDYDDRTGNNLPPAQVNGLDHSPLDGIAEEGPEPVPELLVVPPPSKKVLPDRSCLGPPPAKPERPHSVNLSQFSAPPPRVEDRPSSAEPRVAEVPETDYTKAPVVDDVVSEVHSPNLQLSDFGDVDYAGPDIPDGPTTPTGDYDNGIPAAEAEGPAASEECQDQQPPAASEGEVVNETYDSTDNAHEDVNTSGTKKRGKTEGGKKRKGPPKNPYVEAAQVPNEAKTKTGRFDKSEKKGPAEGPDEKELKKREKQRLEREKRELKEKQEREKKEQKERDKKESEMKKKFKVTGHEDPMYQAKVTVTTKGRKNDLPVKNGDVVSIIRTTSCPKGKWLARDHANNYGYVAVEHVELDIREMVELGKNKSNRASGSHMVDGEGPRTANRASNLYPGPAETYSDDSEEWAVDDEDDDVPSMPLSPMGHSRTFSMPNMGNKDLSVNHQHSYSDISANGPNVQNEALQRLTTFFQSPKPAASAAVVTGPALGVDVHPAEEKPPKELDFEDPEMLLLPPPDLYA
ncbi:proline-rich protein 36 [Betta splendens]|uniref:Proline-rich protein 36 n=1 Tax=Betta splendens TaxID=158456 RepID=A0A6P7MF77_BETSP|nr:proline-rich protein 36 [Betta splendens]XP_029005216.1 proline-rich protein 36 [Betta splendens]